MRGKCRAIMGRAARSSGAVEPTILARGGIGTYGRLALATAAIGNSRLLGAGRLGFRSGETRDIRSVNAGLKRWHGWLGVPPLLQWWLRAAVARAPPAVGAALPSTRDQPATRQGCALAAL